MSKKEPVSFSAFMAFILFISLIISLIYLGVGYEENEGLRGNITECRNNLTKTTIEKGMWENRFDVVVNSKFGNINWNDTVCEEFCQWVIYAEDIVKTVRNFVMVEDV